MFVVGCRFVVQYLMLFLVLQSPRCGKDKSWLLYFNCLLLVVLSLPHGAVGWSAVCVYGITWSYSLTFGVIALFGLSLYWLLHKIKMDKP